MTALPQDDFWATPPTSVETDAIWASPPTQDEVNAPRQGQLTPSEQRKRENLATSVISGKTTLATAATEVPLASTGKPFDPTTQVELSPEEIAASRQGMVSSEIYRQLAPQAMGQPTEGFGTRAMAGLKLTPEGVRGYLKSKYPTAQIHTDPKSGAVIIAEPGKPPRFLDLRGRAEVGDLADVSGEALELGLGVPLGMAGIAASGGTATVPAAMGAAAAANAARQGVAALVPGEDDLSIPERLGMVTLSGAAGGAGQLAAKGIAKGFKAITPTARLSRQIGKELVFDAPEEALAGTGKPILEAADEGARLGRETGVPLTASQASGSRVAKGLEDALRTGPETSGRMFQLDVDRALALQKGVGKTLDEAFGPKVSAVEAGRRTAKAYDTNLNSLVKDLYGKAGAEMDAVIRETGDLKHWKPLKMVERLDKLVKESSAPTSKSGRYLKGLRQKLVTPIYDDAGTQVGEKVRSFNLRQFQNMLSDLGAEAKGTGDVFTRIATAKKKRLGRELFDAALEDLDEMTRIYGTDADSMVRESSKKLIAARGSYKRASEAVRSAKNPLLQKALRLASEDQPEKLPNILLSAQRSDEEVSKTLLTVAGIDPDAALTLQRASLESLLRRSAPKPTSGLAREGVILGPKEFAGLAEKNKTRIEALFAGDREGLASWNKLVEVSKRISDAPYSAKVGKPSWSDKIIKAVGMIPGKGAGAVKLAGYAKKLFTVSDDKLIRLLNDPEARDLLLKLYTPKPGTTHAQYGQLVGQLVSLSQHAGILEKEKEEISEWAATH